MMRNALLTSAMLGGMLIGLGTVAHAAPATGLQGIKAPAATVTQVDYYWNHRHWHHRRWYHHHWQYW